MPPGLIGTDDGCTCDQRRFEIDRSAVVVAQVWEPATVVNDQAGIQAAAVEGETRFKPTATRVRAATVNVTRAPGARV
jgi:hypothetical protein